MVNSKLIIAIALMSPGSAQAIVTVRLKRR